MRMPDKQNRWLLVIALALALMTYYYVNDALKHSSGAPSDPSYRLIKLTAKTVPVKVRFASTPPEGYRLLTERVKVVPEQITLVGPEALLEETSSAETAILDISQTTRQINKVIPLESVAGIHLTGESYLVEVTVPIEKLDTNQ
jgi:YbbR domain-containing protein